MRPDSALQCTARADHRLRRRRDPGHRRLDPPDLPRRGIPQNCPGRAAQRVASGGHSPPGGHDHPRDGRPKTCRFTSGRNESGLRIVFIQPVDEPADLAALPAAGDPGYSFLYQSCPLPTLLWKRRAEGFCLISFNPAARKLLGEELELSLGLPPAGVLASVAEFFECMQRCLAGRPNEKGPPHRCGGPLFGFPRGRSNGSSRWRSYWQKRIKTCPL